MLLVFLPCRKSTTCLRIMKSSIVMWTGIKEQVRTSKFHLFQFCEEHHVLCVKSGTVTACLVPFLSPSTEVSENWKLSGVDQKLFGSLWSLSGVHWVLLGQSWPQLAEFLWKTGPEASFGTNHTCLGGKPAQLQMHLQFAHNRKHFCPLRVTQHCCRLSREVVESPSLGILETHLGDSAWGTGWTRGPFHPHPVWALCEMLYGLKTPKKWSVNPEVRTWGYCQIKEIPQYLWYVDFSGIFNLVNNSLLVKYFILFPRYKIGLGSK